MPYDESDLLAISGLQHLAFCERQWGLIHLEQVWTENVLTAEGRVLHERAHDAGAELRGDLLTTRAVRLRSLRLGLAGVADVVEFHRVGHSGPEAVHLPGRRGHWRPEPVEYKRGKPKRGGFDRVQLCAQALCLEEMLGVMIAEGALFYGQPRRRELVAFDAPLRAETEALAVRMHALFAAGRTPPGVFEKKCKSCSLLELCRPEKIRSSHSAAGYLSRALADLEDEDAP